MVCPHHGIIASNPLPLLIPAAMAAVKYGPQVLGAAKGLFGGKRAIQEDVSPQAIARQSGYPIQPIKVNQPILVDID